MPSQDTPRDGLCCAVLMCHAPIVIPAIGGPRASECAKTTRAMREIAQRLVQWHPDVLVCLSPHTPRLREAFGLVPGGVSGSFARFGAPEVRVDLPGDLQAARALLAAAPRGLVEAIEPEELDHGAAVPLWFAADAGWRGPTLLLAMPWRHDHDENRALGVALEEAARADGRRWAVLASGDMSHSLKPGAPSGYHPDGARFDASFTELLERGDLDQGLLALDRIRTHAAEDVVDTVEVAVAALGFPSRREVLSYEGPFGVGYCIAELSPPPGV